jgi:hypothetical protein
LIVKEGLKKEIVISRRGFELVGASVSSSARLAFRRAVIYQLFGEPSPANLIARATLCPPRPAIPNFGWRALGEPENVRDRLRCCQGKQNRPDSAAGFHALKSHVQIRNFSILGNLLRDAASNVSSCSTWQLTYKKLIHRFDAQASWQGNRWVISLFLSLRSKPLQIIVLRRILLHSLHGARRASRPRPQLSDLT